jgi:hypothetical protein
MFSDMLFVLERGSINTVNQAGCVPGLRSKYRVALLNGRHWANHAVWRMLYGTVVTSV